MADSTNQANQGSSSSSQNPSSSSSIPPPTAPPPPTQDEKYSGSMSDYCKLLENWMTKVYWQRVTATSAYYTALSILNPGGFQQHPPQANGFPPNIPHQQQPNGFNNNNNVGNPLNYPQPHQGQGGQRQAYSVFIRGIRVNGNRTVIDFNIAPIWKRLLAEVIDFLILLVVKIFITLTLIDNFDLIDFENIDLDAFQESGSLYDIAISLSSELILLEFTHRLVVCIFEAYCLFKGGATPGKSIMGLRVLQCDAVYPIIEANRINNNNYLNGGPGSRILVSPGSYLSFPYSLFRSIIKNFSIAFFPLCFVLYPLEHQRTLYDMAAKSIVVEIQVPA